MQRSRNYDRNFAVLLKSLAHTLEGRPVNDLAHQRGQVEALFAAEDAFRDYLLSLPCGREVYEQFVAYITHRNLLVARIYFRERDITYKTYISPAIKANDIDALCRYHVNYQFMLFALANRNWDEVEGGGRLSELARELLARREVLIEENMPLAISRARLFWTRNQNSHMSFLDMVSCAAMGLAIGIDKYVGPYTRTFRAVLIGRMIGELIPANSQTFIRLYASDKRRLYRIRKLVNGMREDLETADYADLTRQLRQYEANHGDAPTSYEDVRLLAAATTVIFASTRKTGEDEQSEDDDRCDGYLHMAPDVGEDVEECYSQHELGLRMATAIRTLSPRERKILRLHGVTGD